MTAKREPKIHFAAYDPRRENVLRCGYASKLVTEDRNKVTCKECLRLT